jgi:Saxitoxin biosynthesis operon protein SxtJ
MTATPQRTMHEDLSRDDAVTPSSNRALGCVFAGVLGLVGLWPLLQGHPVRTWGLTLAGAFLGVAWVRPALLGPLNRVWTRVGLLLHGVVSPLVLGLVFYGVVAPMGLAMRLLGKDPLRRRFDPGAASYWIEREPPGPAPHTMRQQF